jgi:hypothetical protein
MAEQKGSPHESQEAEKENACDSCLSPWLILSGNALIDTVKCALLIS